MILRTLIQSLIKENNKKYIVDIRQDNTKGNKTYLNVFEWKDNKTHKIPKKEAKEIAVKYLNETQKIALKGHSPFSLLKGKV